MLSAYLVSDTLMLLMGIWADYTTHEEVEMECVFVWNAHMRAANILCLMWIQNRIIIYLIHRNYIVCLCPIPFHWAFDSDCCRHKRMKKWFFSHIRMVFVCVASSYSLFVLWYQNCTLMSPHCGVRERILWIVWILDATKHEGAYAMWNVHRLQFCPHTKNRNTKMKRKRPYMSYDLIHDDFFLRWKYYISVDLFPY